MKPAIRQPAIPTRNCTVFRKSENTNSFGLRGYWAVEHEPVPFAIMPSHLRVWEFATSEDLKKGSQPLPFFEDLSSPAYELPTLKGYLPTAKLGAFLRKFNLEN